MKTNHLIANTFALMALLFMVSIQTARATYACVGATTVFLGETTKLELASTYKNTLKMSSVSVSYYRWWSENTSYVKVSTNSREQAVIRGVSVTSSPCKVYYECSYWIDGQYRRFEFYYNVTVRTSTSGLSVSLSPSEAVLEVGQSLNLYGTIYPTRYYQQFTWMSLNKKVATVEGGASNYNPGTVTAQAVGTTNIYCSALTNSGKYATCDITVVKPKVASIYSSTSLPVTIEGSNGKTSTVFLGTAFVDYPVSLKTLRTQSVTAYYANYDSSTQKVKLTKMSGSYIPASTGMILSSNEAKEHIELENLNTDTAATINANMLIGTIKKTEVFSSNDAAYYILTKLDDQEEGGFYYQNRRYWEGTSLEGKDAGTGVVCYQNKAALRVPKLSSTAKLSMIFDNGTTTAIDNVSQAKIKNNDVYNLQGQKVNPTIIGHGIYIQNGEKIIVK